MNPIDLVLQHLFYRPVFTGASTFLKQIMYLQSNIIHPHLSARYRGWSAKPPRIEIVLF
jgi:hypothetical protein